MSNNYVQNVWVVLDKCDNEIVTDNRGGGLLISKTKIGAKYLKVYWYGTCRDFVVRKATINVVVEK